MSTPTLCSQAFCYPPGRRGLRIRTLDDTSGVYLFVAELGEDGIALIVAHYTHHERASQSLFYEAA